MSHSAPQFESLLKCTLGWGKQRLSPLLFASGAPACNNLVTATVEYRWGGSVTAGLIQIYVMEHSKGSIHNSSLRASVWRWYVANNWSPSGDSVKVFIRSRFFPSLPRVGATKTAVYQSADIHLLYVSFLLSPWLQSRGGTESCNHNKMLKWL